jgi:hypothetical protein
LGGKRRALWNVRHAQVPANAAKVQRVAGQQAIDGVTEQPEIKNVTHPLPVIEDRRLRDKDPIKAIGRAEHRSTDTGHPENPQLLLAVVNGVQDKN